MKLILVMFAFVLVVQAEISFLDKDVEALRWQLLPEHWVFKKEHLFKGKYYRIPRAKTIVTEFELEPVMNIYDNPELKGKPSFRIGRRVLFKNDNKQKVCASYLSENPVSSTEYLECHDDYCEKKIGANSMWVSIGLDLKYDLRKSPSGKCPYDISYISTSGEFEKNKLGAFYFDFITIAPDKSYLEIKVNDKSNYLDIRGCKDQKVFKCEVVNIKQSKLDEAIANLEKVKEEKSHYYLNLAIEKMLPCVRRKDYKCLKNHFATKEDLDFEEFIEAEINKEIIKELEVCLKYESLLPHLKGSRGINKMCIFNEGRGDFILKNVTYPEALLSSGTMYLPLTVEEKK